MIIIMHHLMKQEQQNMELEDIWMEVVMQQTLNQIGHQDYVDCFSEFSL